MAFCRASIIREITNTLDSSSCFIIHCLNKNPTYLSLHEVISLFSKVPILVLCITNGTVRARCSIPQVLHFNHTFNVHFNISCVCSIYNLC